MNKVTSVIVIVLVMLMVAPTMLAADYSKIKVPIKLDFINNNEFYMKWDGGNEHFNWENNSVHDDVSFDIMVFSQLNESVLCDDKVSEYKNLTYAMTSVVEICADLADGNNVSLMTELSDIKYSLGLQTEKLNACKGNLTSVQDAANKYDSCDRQKTIMAEKLTTCEENIETESKSGDTLPVITGLGGALAVYLMMRKKSSAASEYSEEGFEDE